MDAWDVASIVRSKHRSTCSTIALVRLPIACAFHGTRAIRGILRTDRRNQRLCLMLNIRLAYAHRIGTCDACAPGVRFPVRIFGPVIVLTCTTFWRVNLLASRTSPSLNCLAAWVSRFQATLRT